LIALRQGRSQFLERPPALGARLRGLLWLCREHIRNQTALAIPVKAPPAARPRRQTGTTSRSLGAALKFCRAGYSGRATACPIALAQRSVAMNLGDWAGSSS
jgi:hypothetical protein